MYAIASSGGKDSTYALHQARKKGFCVTHLFHIYNADTSQVRFHGYKPEMIEEQAKVMGLKSIITPTRTQEFDIDFNAALKKVKNEGLSGLIFANIFLDDIRRFYETRVRNAGLEYHDVLWGMPSRTILEDFIRNGFKAVVTSVWLEKLDRRYLGREINQEFLRDIDGEGNVDLCGENGEYHSLAYDGPCFNRPLSFKVHGVREEAGNVFLDLRKR